MDTMLHAGKAQAETQMWLSVATVSIALEKFSDVHKLCIGSHFPQSATPLQISTNITTESIILPAFLFLSCSHIVLVLLLLYRDGS